MRAIILQLTFLLGIPMIAIYPHIGVYLYYWFTWLNPHRLVWGLLNLDWAKIIALTTILIAFFARGDKKIPFGKISTLAFIFFLWTSLTTVMAKYPDVAKGAYIDWMKIIVMMTVTMALIKGRARLHGLIWIVCISMGFWGVKTGAFTLISAGNYHVVGPPKSAIFDTNEIARAFMMAIPLMYYLALQSSYKYVRWTLLLVTGLTALGLVGTTSRTVFAVFVLMIFIWWLRSGSKFKISVASLTVITIVLIALPQERIEGLIDQHNTTVEYETDGSFQSRVLIWTYIVEELAAKNPITGGGFKSVLIEMELEPHSNYFQVLGEHGYVGLAIYLLLGLAALLQTNIIYNQAKRYPELNWAKDLAQMLQLSIIGYFAAGVTKNHAFFEFYYMQLAMVVSLQGCVAAVVKDKMGAVNFGARNAQ